MYLKKIPIDKIRFHFLTKRTLLRQFAPDPLYLGLVLQGWVDFEQSIALTLSPLQLK